jgi:aspartate racemase
LDELRKVTDVKFISMIELVAKKCTKKKYKIVALLGSPVLIKSGIYEKELSKYKIKTLIPSEQEIAVLDHMIRSILAGKKEHKKRKEYVQLINRLYNEGAEAIILGCTELPMAINYEALGDKMLNSDEILAEGIVDYYYKK